LILYLEDVLSYAILEFLRFNHIKELYENDDNFSLIFKYCFEGFIKDFSDKVDFFL